MALSCRDAAALLDRYSLLLLLAGDNPYRARAFSTAAEQLSALNIPLTEALYSGELATKPGIGKGVLAVLEELSRTGSIAHLVELETHIPRGVVELTYLRGVGPQKARQLWQEFGTTSIDTLEIACRNHQLAGKKGFTERTEAALLEAIAFWRSQFGYIHRHKAWHLIEQLRGLLNKHGIEELIPSGQIRRGFEVVNHLCLIAIAVQPTEIQFPPEFTPYPDQTYRLHHESGITIDIVVTTPDTAGSALVRTTGSTDFVAALEEGSPLPSTPTEEQLFAQLGLPLIPPELRDDASIVKQARHGTLPLLIEPSFMRGVIHVHTTWSDGKHTLEEMAIAAQRLGFEYIAICDHSQSAAYAGGLDPQRVAQQRQQIVDLNARQLGITVLHGIESDILPDGSLDYPDEILAQFDIVVASIHSQFNLPKEQQTQRMIRAIENPYTAIVGHPTGRLLLRREGYQIDLEKILNVAARTGTIVEFNLNPYRFDLDWRYHTTATARGILLATNPDAHSIEDLHYIFDGISVARRGRLTPEHVINTLPLDNLQKLLSQLRQQKQHYRISS